MTFHQHWFRGLEEILLRVFAYQEYSDKAIQQIFQKHKKWGARDRAFVAENAYEIIRWNKKLRFAMGLTTDDFFKNEANLIIPKIIVAHIFLKYGEIPSFYQMNIDEEKVKDRWLNPPSPEIDKSVSSWLWKKGYEQLGMRWAIELDSMNMMAPVYLRVNSHLISRENLLDALRAEGVEAREVESLPHGLVLEKRLNVFRIGAFRKGFFEVQDGGSQLIAPFLEVEPGMRVIDACAGAGGKTLHMASLMMNKGHIIAMDVVYPKLEELRKRARRLKLYNIETRLINSKEIKRLKESADRLLLDVPCTGTGVLRRNPDAKWRINQKLLDDVKEKQREILESYVRMLRKGGKMVYATCTLFPVENENQIHHFLLNNDTFELEDMKYIYPSETGFDGFFMARLRKK
ncbi:MAG: methyltransferase domain-containing protein [Bacteroidales bacterium]|nr:methyltransferase domain-containing protein [Bacteroidales bacterium]